MVERAQEARGGWRRAEARGGGAQGGEGGGRAQSKAAREAAATAAANVKRSAEEQRRVAEKAAAAIRAKNAATAAAGRPAPATSTTSLTSLGGAHSGGAGALQGLLAKKQATAVHKPSLATPSAPAQRLGGAVRVTQEEAYQSYEISPYRENSDSEDDAPRSYRGGHTASCSPTAFVRSSTWTETGSERWGRRTSAPSSMAPLAASASQASAARPPATAADLLTFRRSSTTSRRWAS